MNEMKRIIFLQHVTTVPIVQWLLTGLSEMVWSLPPHIANTGN